MICFAGREASPEVLNAHRTRSRLSGYSRCTRSWSRFCLHAGQNRSRAPLNQLKHVWALSISRRVRCAVSVELRLAGSGRPIPWQAVNASFQEDRFGTVHQSDAPGGKLARKCFAARQDEFSAPPPTSSGSSGTSASSGSVVTPWREPGPPHDRERLRPQASRLLDGDQQIPRIHRVACRAGGDSSKEPAWCVRAAVANSATAWRSPQSPPAETIASHYGPRPNRVCLLPSQIG